MSAEADQLESIHAAIQQGRLAHAYIVQGTVRGNAERFVDTWLKTLYCGPDESTWEASPACRRLEAGSHPDVLKIEPESKSRQIRVEQINELLRRIQQTSFEGGWKVVVVYFADRINQVAQNKILKTLEEPPDQSLLILVTDSPQLLLPTIVSRCQIVRLPVDAGLDPRWAEPVIELLIEAGMRDDPVAGLTLADGLQGLVNEMKAEISNAVKGQAEAVGEELAREVLDARITARVKQVNSELLRSLQHWYRDILLAVEGVDPACWHHQNQAKAIYRIAADTTYIQAARRLQSIEIIARRMEGNMQFKVLAEVELG